LVRREERKLSERKGRRLRTIQNRNIQKGISEKKEMTNTSSIREAQPGKPAGTTKGGGKAEQRKKNILHFTRRGTKTPLELQSERRRSGMQGPTGKD